MSNHYIHTYRNFTSAITRTIPNTRSFFMGIIFSLLMLSCTPEVEPIQYGKHQCHSCKMNIVDRVHAAQYVTSKGKNFKFDAIECLIWEFASKEDLDTFIVLVADYGQPGQMTEASSATYQISPSIKSPMGAFLSAFSDISKAKEAQEQFGGKLYTWDEVQKQIQLQK